MTDIKYLSLGSGGVNVFMLLGAMQWLYDNDQLGNVEHYTGCSAGGVIILLMLCGFTPKELTSNFLDFRVRFGSIFSRSELLDDKALKELLEKHVGKTLMKDLPVKVTISVFNLNTLDVEYIDRDDTPDVSVLDACLMTSRIPFFFSPYKDLYLDGAILDPFPIRLLPVSPHTLGIGFDTPAQTYCTRVEYSIVRLFYTLLSVLMKRVSEPLGDKYKIIRLVKSCSDLNFTASSEKRIELYLSGYEQMIASGTLLDS